MIEANYSFCTSDDVNILGKSWQPTDSYKGLIILVHGFGEHILATSQILDTLTHVVKMFGPNMCLYKFLFCPRYS